MHSLPQGLTVLNVHAVHAVHASSFPNLVVRIFMKFCLDQAFLMFLSSRHQYQQFLQSMSVYVYQTSNHPLFKLLAHGTWVLMGQKHRSPKSDLQQGDLARKRFTVMNHLVLPCFAMDFHVSHVFYAFPFSKRATMCEASWCFMEPRCFKCSFNQLSASFSDPCEHKFGASRSVGRGTWPAFQKSKPFRRFPSPDSGYSGFCLPPRKS